MKLFKRIAQACEPYQRLLEELREGKSPVLMVGASEIHKAHFIYAAADELPGPALILTHDEQSARFYIRSATLTSARWTPFHANTSRCGSLYFQGC